MKKQMNKNLFKAMLLPVIVLLLALWVSTGVVAEDLTEYRVIILVVYVVLYRIYLCGL